MGKVKIAWEPIEISRRKKSCDEMWEEIALFDPTKYPRKDAVEG